MPNLSHFARVFIATFGLGFPLTDLAFSQTPDLASGPAAKSIERLGLDLSMGAVAHDAVRRSLEVLEREPCDQKAIVDLGVALDRAGYRREEAKAHIKFSQLCGGHAPSLRTAANIFLNLSDYAAAAEAASELIGMAPFGNNGYFLRAIANEKLGQYRKAIDDYSTAIELYADKSHISSVSYEGLARSYDKLGRSCDAAASIETWVSSNPAGRDTSQSRSMIKYYQSKGGCSAAPVTKEEVFPVSRPNHVVVLQVTVNGVRGNFVLDTGATFVCMKSSFAQKANVPIDQDSSLKLSTANGIVDAKGGLAKSIQLRSLQALEVSVAVQADNQGLYGPNVDGLLGMSFLSRFNVVMDGKTVKVKKATAG